MSRIIKIEHFQNKGEYALVNVLMDDGTEAVVYVGGDCEVFFDKGIVKCFVKRGPDETSKHSRK
jgi:hypothetical protein